MSKVAIIVAMAKNRTIGINNALPWHLPADLKHFKALTMGHHIVMGRKTYDSIGRPLPGRTTVVVSHDHELKIDGCRVAHSLPEAILACADDPQVFIIGGAEIYRQALDLADTLHITEIQQDVIGDTAFPTFNKADWQEISRERHHQEVPQALEYHFVEYRRKR
ncbi:MAG TPA: dihydrofolate reductase [Gallionella sp.]|nr:dihydrofolate reductase [Gallionella sp.]